MLIVILFCDIDTINAQTLLTQAEKSDFRETSTFEDVVDFLHSLQKQSNEIRLMSIGQSIEGRELYVAILGTPVPVSSAQLLALNKPAIYIKANIHAGEVEGKEAALMLMREILLGKLHHLLDNQVLLINPNYNPDGNEKISATNRRSQKGPEAGVGVRHNGQFLDLNRDYIKLESPENLATIQQILNQWDPMLLIDLHTTNGSYHQEPLTYATSHNPNGNPALPDFIRKQLFPDVSKRLESQYNIMSVPYGYFADNTDPSKGWETFNHQAFYSTNYWGLRNRFSILDENYSYADFKTRVQACYHFVELILEFTRQRGKEMQSLLRQVDAETIARAVSPDTTAKFGIEIEATPFEKPLLIHSYEFEKFQDERGRTRVKKTDQLKNYEVPFLANFKITKSVTLPKGYLFSRNLKEVAEKLQQHGILVEQLAEPIRWQVQAFQVEKIDNSGRIYQGHNQTTITGNYKFLEMDFPAGTYFVGMNQPLADLAANLLEPESDGGLVRWNFFDRYLYSSQWGNALNQFPVYKLMQPAKFARASVSKK